MPGLHDINYVDRLKSCNVELLELRRIPTDLIMLYKTLNGLICVNIDNFLTLSTWAVLGYLSRGGGEVGRGHLGGQSQGHRGAGRIVFQ